MTGGNETKPQSIEQDADALTRLGGWLFRHRTAMPVPIVAALLVIPPSSLPPALRTMLPLAGVLVVAIGESLRLWAVHHIGVISRTRSDRLGPLIDSGPFSLVRNPLYLGNILLWVGFAFAARLPWLALPIAALLSIEYHAIVRWEERLLESRLGPPYRAYLGKVPRWLPRIARPKAPDVITGRFSWGETLFSERSTLVAIAVGYILVAVKT